MDKKKTPRSIPSTQMIDSKQFSKLKSDFSVSQFYCIFDRFLHWSRGLLNWKNLARLNHSTILKSEDGRTIQLYKIRYFVNNKLKNESVNIRDIHVYFSYFLTFFNAIEKPSLILLKKEKKIEKVKPIKVV